MSVSSRTSVAAARQLLVFPYNGNGIEAADCLGGAWALVGYVDDTVDKQGRGLAGVTVGSRTAFDEFPDAAVLAVPGGPASYRQRREIIDGLGIEQGRFATVVHPRATVSVSSNVGRNVLLMAGVVVTSNARIGDHVCVLPNSVIHHDTVVGDWTLVGAGVTIAGGCSIGSNCYIASGTSVRDGIHIGDGALVGLGSTVVRDVLPGTRVAGCPARTLD